MLDSIWKVLWPYGRKGCFGLYAKWQRSQVVAYSIWMNVTAILILLLGFFAIIALLDYPIGPWAYANVIQVLASISMWGLLIVLKNQDSLSSKLISRATLIFAPILSTFLSIYLIVSAKSSIEIDVNSMLIGVVACAYVVGLYRYWMEQYLFQSISVACFLVACLLYPQHQMTFVVFIFIHWFCFTLSVYLRWPFIKDLDRRYKNLRTFIPWPIAYDIVTHEESLASTKRFAVKRRFVVCLSATWRNYHELLTKKGAGRAASLTEAFYDVIFKFLDRAVPDGSYYASWSTDEFFVVFFDYGDNPDHVVKRALNFCFPFADEIPRRTMAKLKYPLIFDIGIAAGFGLLGLQGPRQMRKTTVTSVVAGQAKRLETTVRLLRDHEHIENPLPQIAFDESIYRWVRKDRNFSTVPFKEAVAKLKDIEDRKYYVWQAPLSPSLDQG